ncbi:MAG: hypothetical protein K2K41_00075 [Ruminiclostridium sp.]|nr:hypothetical protein [Ruminiclostridium sp.]
MIVFENRTWQINSAAPDTNYLEGLDCEQPKWIVSDDSELASKIRSVPYWDPVEDENGGLIDIIPAEPTVSDEESILLLKSQLEDLDRLAIRPLRAILAGNEVEEDRDVLADLEEQAKELRERLSELENDMGEEEK